MEITFQDGIYFLSLLRCLQKDEILVEDVINWNARCFQDKIRKRDDEYKTSYFEPEKNIPLEKIHYLHVKVLECMKSFLDDKRLLALDNFLNMNYLKLHSGEIEDWEIEFESEDEKWLRENRVNEWIVINELLFELSKCGLKYKGFQSISQEELKNFAEPYLDNLYTLWKMTDFNAKLDKKIEVSKQIVIDNLQKLSSAITNFNFKLEYGKEGCIQNIPRNIEKLPKILGGFQMLKEVQPKMDTDFYVYRSIRESKSYNPETKITKLLLNDEIVEDYTTMISTTWDLNFALHWSGVEYCCLYVIKVPKDSDYLILKDSFDITDDKSQHEITLGPGRIILNNIKTCEVKVTNTEFDTTSIIQKTIFVFLGEYQSYNNENEITTIFNSKLCESEKKRSRDRGDESDDEELLSKKSKLKMKEGR